MSSRARVYWLYALSSLHVGSGRGVGLVDLPLMREKVTGWPVIPGSTVKGIMRSYFSKQAEGRGGTLPSDGAAEGGRPAGNGLIDFAFGRGGDETASAGALAYGDARLVLLPVRSLYGTFAWVSSPLCLQRLTRDLRGVGLRDTPPALDVSAEAIAITQSSALTGPDGKVYLEDLDFMPDTSGSEVVSAWAEFLSQSLFPQEPAWRDIFTRRLALVHDDAFTVLAEVGTEVVARIKIAQESKTVEPGHLWYEENLPPETVLAGIVWSDDSRRPVGTRGEDLLEVFCRRPVNCQVGGKSTVGRGLVRCLFQGGDGM